MKRRTLKWVISALLVLVVAAILFVRNFWMDTFGPGSTAEETARILVHDLDFGGRAKHKAVEYGDRILPLLEVESENFSRLNGRNSFWIAEVLAAIKTDKSRAILLDLYSRTNSIAKLTGAVGLAQQSVLAVEIDEGCFLVQTVRNASSQTETQLAIIALGWSKKPAALPCLLDLLQQRGVDYWYHAYACAAVARIGLKDATPILRGCLRSPEFHALPEAFRALICLGDSEAVPLAIARVSPGIKGYNSGFLVGELKKVTGKSYGYDQNSWRNWWQSTQGAWQIPEEFRKSWDEQKGLY